MSQTGAYAYAYAAQVYDLSANRGGVLSWSGDREAGVEVILSL